MSSTLLTEEFHSAEELNHQLHMLQQQLKETELRLCEKDIENVKLKIKYNAYQNDSQKTISFWKAHYFDIEYSLNLVLHSKTWRLRTFLLSPLIKYHERKAALQKVALSPEPEKTDPIAPIPLSELPSNPVWEDRLMKSPRIAIQVHAFYPDLIVDICHELDKIPFQYDLYVTTTEAYKATYITKYLSENCNASNYQVDVVENIGRDVIPFLQQLRPVISDYDYFCHLHTKRSLHYEGGKLWRLYLYENLLGNTKHIKKIISEFEHNPKVGVIFPSFNDLRIVLSVQAISSHFPSFIMLDPHAFTTELNTVLLTGIL